MAESKQYLNVPYAQKDAAKALGARWDATNKKWYVPIGKDIELFAAWQTDSNSEGIYQATTSKQLTKLSTSKIMTPDSQRSGAFTYPSIPDFVAYSGNEPPWV